MQIEIGFAQTNLARIAIIVSSAFLVIGCAFLGRFVTPMVDGVPTLLTLERWQAAKLQRKAASETVAIQRDFVSLRTLAQRENADPVAAMLLAQRLYARHQTGTSATATARNALVDAAAIHAQYAAGSKSLDAVVNAINRAATHLEKLQPTTPDDAPEKEPDAALWLDPVAAL